MKNSKNKSTPSKKTGRRKWRFEPRGVKRTTVYKAINFFGNQWRFSGSSKTTITQGSYICSKNFPTIELIPLDEDISKFDILGALDLYVIFKLLSRKFGKNIIEFDKKFNHVFRICTLKDPIVGVNDLDNIANYHYICLERNPQFPNVWNLRVRKRAFILNNSLSHPYNLAGRLKI